MLFYLAFNDVAAINNHVSLKVTQFVCESVIRDDGRLILHNALNIMTEYFDPSIVITIASFTVQVDTKKCRLTFNEAGKLYKEWGSSPSNVVNLIISDSITERYIAGFAPISGRHAFVELHESSSSQELAIIIAHEIGHVLSLRHTFAGVVSEHARAEYMAFCPYGDEFRNLMDYLPSQCGGRRYFVPDQLYQMKWSLLRRKLAAMAMLIASVIGMVISACECYSTFSKVSARRIRCLSRFQYEDEDDILNNV